MPAGDLPLKYLTPPSWAAGALRSPLELLNDHAHLEKKAAANALELLNRWPQPNPPEHWVARWSTVAHPPETSLMGHLPETWWLMAK